MYVPEEYPRMLYNRDGASRIVESAAEHARFGREWGTKPDGSGRLTAAAVRRLLGEGAESEEPAAEEEEDAEDEDA